MTKKTRRTIKKDPASRRQKQQGCHTTSVRGCKSNLGAGKLSVQLPSESCMS